jgi:mono/diheme cytochrome c family protein
MLGACQMPAPVASTPAPANLAAAHRLAQGSCGGCHSVEAYGLSPNPASPAFAEIANRPGLTGETLTTWLRDAHNYPEEMEFSLEGDEVALIAAHITSLRRPGYQPPNQ